MTLDVRTNDTLLEVNHVNVDYLAANGTVHAVSDVSLKLARGEILGLVGESGSGKSTLAYAIARLLRPPAEITGGEVLYYPRVHEGKDGQSMLTTSDFAGGKRGGGRAKAGDLLAEREVIDIFTLTPAQLRAFRWNELAIVFQSAMNALNPVMRIGTQIIDVLQTHRPDLGPDSRRQRAIELLKLVGIAPDRLNSYPHELSGGMRQRAIIAIALALRPEMIIMDEPTTALDVVVQREILELVSGLCREFGMTMIFITHDLSLLLELADRIAVMYAGKLIEMSSSKDLIEHPRHPYSYGLLNSFPTLRGPRHKMVGIPGYPPDLRAVPSGCPFHPRCPLAFDACHSVVPGLQPATPEAQGEIVACHLYNPKFHEGIPATEELAASYEKLAERSSAR